MNIVSDLGEFYKNRNTFIVGNEPTVFHCHHYNCFLQMSIEQTRNYIDIYSILIDSAQEIAHSQFNSIFFSLSISNHGERKKIVEDYFSFCGFGKINISSATREGGEFITTHDHYAIGWLQKFGIRSDGDPGVSFFTTGFITGAIESIFGLPLGALCGLQTTCLTKGDKCCTFIVRERQTEKKFGLSPRQGTFQRFNDFTSPHDTGIDYLGVRDALINMPLHGSREDGLIKAFGVYLTRHYANYYMLVTLKAMLAMEARYGNEGLTIISDMLVEAGHVCAFNTFGGIMLSAEWNALILPMMKDKENPDEWIHGIVACANAFGWGYLKVKGINADGRSSFETISSYETNAALSYAPSLRTPLSFLMQGGFSGVMNLTYHGDIMSHPVLDEEFYNKIFKTPGKFSSQPVKSRMLGEEVDSFEVSR